MRRALLPAALLALLLAVALILASALARPAAPAPGGGAARVEQVDTGAYPQITLYVAVADPGGRPLAGLGSDDFAVTEDGAPVELLEFAGGGAGPVTSALVVDRSGSMEDEAKLEGAQAAAESFVELLRPGDRAALVPFNEDVAPAAFTDDRAELRDAIDALRADGGTALYDAVVAGVELLRDQPGRRLLVVLSDGQDCSAAFDSCPAEYGSDTTLDEAIAYAQAAGQSVAVVGLGDRAGGGEQGIDEGVLQRIAEETGGRYFYAPDAAELADLYATLAGDVQQEYRLTYLSPRPFYDGTRRDIQVQAGSSLAAGAYTERHLINVVSNPLVGLVLLTPLAGLLILPAALRRRKQPAARPVGAGASSPAPSALATASPAGPALALPAGAMAAAGAGAVPVPGGAVAAGGPAPTGPAAQAAPGRRCVGCDAPLRETARFCSACGTTQPVAPAPAEERRTFCDMCGQPLAPGASFCMSCGEPVAARRQPSSSGAHQ